MTRLPDAGHILVLYRSSERADAALRLLCQRARERATRVTVVVLARQEAVQKGCCDTRSVLWNDVCRQLAREDLSRASRAVEDHAAVQFDVLVAQDRRVADVVADEAVACGADEIVFADPRASGLGRLERRRLRHRSAVPVRA